MKQILLAFILSSIFFNTQALHPDFKSEQNKTELIRLYKQYLNTLPKGLDTLQGFKILLKPVTLKKIIPHLDIELSLQEIKENYKKTGFIQFRKIDPNLRTLVIGCGNRPSSYFFGDPDCVVLDKKYRMAHVHEGAVTVDPDFRRNATIVAYFGVKQLKNLADNSFDRVFAEGMSFSGLLEVKRLASELRRVLVKDGTFYFDLKGG